MDGTSDKVSRIRAYVNNIFDHIEDADEKRAAYIHTYGVSHCCAVLAMKRGLNFELATVIGLLHDVHPLQCFRSKALKELESS